MALCPGQFNGLPGEEGIDPPDRVSKNGHLEASRCGYIAWEGEKMRVGVRELRDGLSKHLASVRDGHTVTVTDHGRVVARIVPAGAPTKLEALVDSGRVTPGRGRRSVRRPPVKSSGTVSDLVEQQRR